MPWEFDCKDDSCCLLLFQVLDVELERVEQVVEAEPDFGHLCFLVIYQQAFTSSYKY